MKPNKVLFVKRTNRPFFIADGRPVGFYQAEKGGAPVLKEEGSWRKINGFYFNIRRLHLFVGITFRRFS